jgi:hypothetical protein
MPDETPGRNARLWKRTLLAKSGAGVIPANLRNVTREDVPSLGALLFGAFLGTIDDAGQAMSPVGTGNGFQRHRGRLKKLTVFDPHASFAITNRMVAQ